MTAQLPNLDIDNIKGKLSSIVSDQLPEFVKSDHPTFVAFLEAYYEWCEQNGNAIEATRNAKLYNDIDTTVDAFVDYFKQNYLVDLPDSIINDKRTLLKHIKEFYQAKGTDKALILLFRMLFNEEVSVYYPKVDMLRVSAGQFTSDTIMNIKQVTGPAGEMVGKQVVQANQPLQPDINRATGLIENFVGFAVGDEFIYQMTLTDNSVSGTFVAGQIVTIVGDTGTITGVIDEIITGVNIAVGGTYYKGGDPLVTKNLTPQIEKEDDSGYIVSEASYDNVFVTEDIGDSAQFDITSIGRGGITKYLIETGGKGYALDETLSYTDSNLGVGALAKVSRIEGRLISEGSGDGILLESGYNILAGDLREIVKEDGDALLLEDGGAIVPDDADYNGTIHDILIVNEGSNYTYLPIVGVNTTNGEGAKIFAQSNSIGRITGIQRTNLGSGYSDAPLVIPRNNMILEDVEGTFILGETIVTDEYRILKEDASSLLLETGDRVESEVTTVQTGTLMSYDISRQLMQVRVSTYRDNFGAPPDRSRIRGVTSGATASICQCDVATILPTTGTVSTSEGVLFGADGRISESSKKIQDSFYYQDFSYVIKVGNSINIWRDAVKRILHPVGLALFGEVSVSTSVRARLWAGSEIRLNGTTPRYKQIELIINKVLQLTPVAQEQKLELEIFTEMVYAHMFPTRIILESGSGAIQLEDDTISEHYPEWGTPHPHYLRGESEVIGTEKGAVYPKLIFPRFPTPIANIDATMVMLKDVTLFLREQAGPIYRSLDPAEYSSLTRNPLSPNNPTVPGGNQHGKLDQDVDVTIILETFETWLENCTATTSVKHELQIWREISQIARIMQNIVILYLPTITSSDDLQAVATSKIHLIASLGLEDAHLHESFGSAKLGSNGYSLERFKFLFPPYADTRTLTKEDGDEILLETGDYVLPENKGHRKIDRGGRIYRADYNSSVLTADYTGVNTSNNNYWDTYANTQIVHLNDLVTVNDLVNYPGRKLDFAFDSEIFLRDT